MNEAGFLVLDKGGFDIGKGKRSQDIIFLVDASCRKIVEEPYFNDFFFFFFFPSSSPLPSAPALSPNREMV